MQLLPGYRTEIRSRWTAKNLYFLFICPYEELFLHPNPSTTTETNKLWNWDVAEVFIGSDFKNIRHYKEFELSPQGEWLDLDIDLTKPHHEEGWTWNSGFQVAARIDEQTKIWYGAMKIPWTALDDTPPSTGKTLRVNFFRSQGPSLQSEGDRLAANHERNVSRTRAIWLVAIGCTPLMLTTTIVRIFSVLQFPAQCEKR